VIEKQLVDLVVLSENMYNIDETGVLLSMLDSLKVIVDANDLRSHRGAGLTK
jgi:hypothetical protein